MSDELKKAAPELHEVLNRLSDGISGKDHGLLDQHLSRDSEVPQVYNAAALAAHRGLHENSGAYLAIHAGPHHPQEVGKAMANAAGPDARLFRKGGPNFVAWTNDGHEGESFNTNLRNVLPGVITGLGANYGQADAALQHGAGGDDLHTSAFMPAPGWREGRDSVKDARQIGLSAPSQGDAVQQIPGTDILFPHVFNVSPPGYQHEEETMEKAEIKAHPMLKHRMFGNQPFAIIGGDSPRFASRASGHDALRTALQQRGLPHEEVQGFHDGPKRSFMVHGIGLDEATEIGKDFGQGSIIHKSTGEHPIVAHINGAQADSFHPTTGYKLFNKQPKNHWNRVGPAESPLHFDLNVDWNHSHGSELQGMKQHEGAMEKSEKTPLPGEKEWLAGRKNYAKEYDRPDAGVESQAHRMLHHPDPKLAANGARYPEVDWQHPTTPEFQQWFGNSHATDHEGKPRVVFHGTRADVNAFDPATQGAATAAPSAAQGFFFAGRAPTAETYTNMVLPHEKEAHDAMFDEAVNLHKKSLRGYSPDPKKVAQRSDWSKKSSELYHQAHEMRNNGANIMPVYLSLQNPHVHDMKGKPYREQSYNDIITHAKSKGHDGVIIRNTFDAGNMGDALPDDVYVAFHPHQIKSAISNSGFDPKQADVTKGEKE